MKTLQQLQTFTDYCVEHQEERFWQALRNWSGYSAIMAIEKGSFGIGAPGQQTKQFDTFCIEGKRHDDRKESKSSS